MEDLVVLKALADGTRFAMYHELASSTSPLSTEDLAERLGVHANTVRMHLDRLREADLVVAEAVHRGTVGRPQHLYSLAPGAPSLGLDPPAHTLLAGLLAAVAEGTGAGVDEASATGRSWGRDAVRRTRSKNCLAALATELDRLGFEPAVEESDDGAVRMSFFHCPFRELAEAFPELVCNLHRGICEGVVAQAGGGSIEGFGTLYDPEPCQMDILVG